MKAAFLLSTYARIMGSCERSQTIQTRSEESSVVMRKCKTKKSVKTCLTSFIFAKMWQKTCECSTENDSIFHVGRADKRKALLTRNSTRLLSSGYTTRVLLAGYTTRILLAGYTSTRLFSSGYTNRILLPGYTTRVFLAGYTTRVLLAGLMLRYF